MTTLLAEHGPFERLAWQPNSRSLGWWGTVMFIITEAMIFGLLLFIWFFLWAQSSTWPQGTAKEPTLFKIGIRTVLLLGSSLPMWIGERAIKRGNRRVLVASLAAVLALSTVFFLGHLEESHKMWIEGERPGENAYLSAFWTIVNFHAFHLIVGMLLLAGVLVRALMGGFTAERHEGVRLAAMYWHFVDVVWVFVFSSLYLAVVFI